MAKIRKFVAYRRLERPYTRKSKYRAKSYVRASPPTKISRFVLGDKQTYFPLRVVLRAKNELQIRDNALESSRQVVVRRLEKLIGKTGFRFRMRAYPHHFLRENPLAAGAGADRMSTGMAAAFGKVIGRAARIFVDDAIMEVETTPEHIEKAKIAINLSRAKLPCSYQVVVEKVPPRT